MSTTKIPHDVQQAIDDSTGRGVIASLDYSDERAAALRGLCDDWVEGNEGRLEFWGATDEGGDDSMAWRVHLDREDD